MRALTSPLPQYCLSRAAAVMCRAVPGREPLAHDLVSMLPSFQSYIWNSILIQLYGIFQASTFSTLFLSWYVFSPHQNSSTPCLFLLWTSLLEALSTSQSSLHVVGCLPSAKVACNQAFSQSLRRFALLSALEASERVLCREHYTIVHLVWVRA